MKKSKILFYLGSFLLVTISYVIYLISVVTLPTSFYNHSLHLVAFLYLLVPLLFELITRKELSYTILVGYVLFIFASQVLGTAYNMYLKFPPLDIIVHGFSAVLVVLFINTLTQSQLQNLNLLNKIVYFVGSALIVGVVWEIIEFLGDVWLGMNNQVIRQYGKDLVGGAAVKDTMIDIIADLVGAIVGTGIVLIFDKKGKEIK